MHLHHTSRHSHRCSARSHGCDSPPPSPPSTPTPMSRTPPSPLPLPSSSAPRTATPHAPKHGCFFRLEPPSQPFLTPVQRVLSRICNPCLLAPARPPKRLSNYPTHPPRPVQVLPYPTAARRPPTRPNMAAFGALPPFLTSTFIFRTVFLATI